MTVKSGPDDPSAPGLGRQRVSGGGRAADFGRAPWFAGMACAGRLLLQTRALLLGIYVGPVSVLGPSDRLG